LVQIGLRSATGEAVNDQVWARFQGRLGGSYHVDLDGAAYFDGGNLSSLDWNFVKLVCVAAKLLEKIPLNLFMADGLSGPGAREDRIVTS
jgi:hypothetical protein